MADIHTFLDEDDLQQWAEKPSFVALEDSTNKVQARVENWLVPEALWEQDLQNKAVAIQIAANAYHPGGGIFWATAQEEHLMHHGAALDVARQYGPEETIPQRRTPADSFLSQAGMSYRQPLHAYQYINGIIRTDRKIDYTGIFVAGPDFRNDSARKEWTQAAHDNFMENALVNIRQTISHARLQGANTLLLNPIGCGMFQNNPYLVAAAYRIALEEDQRKNGNDSLECIFAIGSTHPNDQLSLVLRDVFNAVLNAKMSDVQRIFNGEILILPNTKANPVLNHHYPPAHYPPALTTSPDMVWPIIVSAVTVIGIATLFPELVFMAIPGLLPLLAGGLSYIATSELVAASHTATAITTKLSPAENHCNYFFRPWSTEDQAAQRALFSGKRDDDQLKDDILMAKSRNGGKLRPDFLQVLKHEKPEIYNIVNDG